MEPFAEAVIEQIRRIEASLNEFRAGNGAAADRIRRLAHTVKGSGASCGFPRVSELAAAVESAPADELAEAVEALISEMRRMRQTSHTVLIVDDDPLIARLLELRLASPDRRIYTAATLGEARAFVAEHRPDVVVLDLFLPDGDGRMLLAELRAAEATSEVPVVVVSGASERSARLEAEAMGADGYLTKPFDPDGVASLVSSVLATSGVRRRGRSILMSAFRRLAGSAISVASIVPETHGPGTRRNDGPDPKVAPAVLDVLVAALPPQVTVAEWSPGEPAVVSPGAFDLTPPLTRARLALRNRPHPYLEGGLATFSAGIVHDAERGGLADAYTRARRVALDANRQGGDRVVEQKPGVRNRRVLLAEPDTATAAMFITRFEAEGFEVEHHPDGVSALEAAESSEFGLIVVATNLPGIDGLGFIRRLRALSPQPPIMVVAAEEREVSLAFDLGADDYLLRSCSPDELIARVRRYV